MKVLVVLKATSLDLFGEYVRKKVAEGLLPAEHLYAMQEGHKEHNESIAVLRQALERQDILYRDVFHGRYWPETEDFDAVIALGGDGTVLDASHHIDNEITPVVGIKSSSGSVGHLCYCDRDSIHDAVSDLKNGKLKIGRVSRLQATVRSLSSSLDLTTSPILNDFLFSNENPAATTQYKISFAGSVERHKSSGIWLSTSAGSSAAMSSAGGKLMGMNSSKFQFRVRELYQPPGSKLSIVGEVFDPDKQDLLIESLCESAILGVDGHHNTFQLGYGDLLSFTRASSLGLALS